MSLTAVRDKSKLSENALTILKARYFHNGEDAHQLFKRVSLGNDKYFDLMSKLLFMPNSPTLFNAGLNNGCTLSACFVFDIDDTMFDSPKSIVNTRAKAIAVAKAGGGVGYYGGNLRPRNSLIKSIHRKACGPLGVLKDMHGVRQLITQGGKRDLAQLWAQPCWHDDTAEIIDCKNEDPKSLESFNISISWTDEAFRDAIQNPNSRYGELFDRQCRAAWKTGCPGVLFYDTINRANPNLKTVGVINATNPCGETPNRSDEPCNLGSLSLRRMVTKSRQIDWNLLEEVTYIATEFLDDILDANVFPHPDITKGALATRKLGLGYMGWANMLALLGIHYGSEESFELAGKVSSFVAAVNRQARKDLVKKKGKPYEAYHPDLTEDECLRNETGTGVAPTGTIAIIVEDSPSIEPDFALETERVTNEGIRMTQKIAVWEDLDGFIPKTAHEVTIEEHIRMQAAFQKNTDLGVSKTINLPNDATVEDIKKAYTLMHKLGCKGGTIYRDGCREEQVLRSSHKPTKSVYTVSPGLTPPSVEAVDALKELANQVDKEVQDMSNHKDNGDTYTPSKKRKLPRKRIGFTYPFTVDGIKCYITANTFKDGTLGEIFLCISPQQGSTADGWCDAFAKTFSCALQHGTPLRSLIKLHKSSRFEPCGLTDDPGIPNCTSIPDFIARFLEREFIVKDPKAIELPMRTGMLCPDCGAMAVYKAGCLSCSKDSCGWSKCG